MPFVGIGVGIGRQRFAQGGGIFAAYAARVAADGGVTEAGACVNAVSGISLNSSLLLVPSGYKSGVVYSQIPTNGDGDLTFTRASSATRVNSDGEIEVVGSGVPRLDYSQGSCPALLLEPQRTNILTRNRAFNLWVIPPTSTPNSATSKYGDTVYSYYGSAIQTSVTVVSNTDYTYSVLAKKSNWNFLVLRTSNYDATANARTWFNLNTGSVGSTSPSYHTNQKIEDFGNGWYLCSITFKSVTSLNGIISISGALTDGSLTAGTTNSQDIFYDAAQVEQGSYATSRINTSGATVTRLADLADESGLSSLIGQTEGTIFLEVKAPNINSDIIGVNRSLTNGIQIFKNTSNNFKAQIYAGGTSIGLQNTTAITDTAKIALVYKSGDSSLFVNGTQVGTSATAFTFSGALDRVQFMGNYFAGIGTTEIHQTLFFDSALSDADCIELTTL
jgi:hypothetical protein